MKDMVNVSINGPYTIDSLKLLIHPYGNSLLEVALMRFSSHHSNPLGPLIEEFEIIVPVRDSIFDDGSKPTYEDCLPFVGKYVTDDCQEIIVALAKHRVMSVIAGLYPYKTNGNNAEMEMQLIPARYPLFANILD